MTENKYDPADPRLTAYVLGELDEAECREVERQLQQCTESQAAVEAIRETVGLVTTALAAEPAVGLTDEQRNAIAQAPAVAAHNRPRGRWAGQFASFAAGVAVTAAVAFLAGQADWFSQPQQQGNQVQIAANNVGDPGSTVRNVGQTSDEISVTYVNPPVEMSDDVDTVHSTNVLTAASVNAVGVEANGRYDMYDVTGATTSPKYIVDNPGDGLVSGPVTASESLSAGVSNLTTETAAKSVRFARGGQSGTQPGGQPVTDFSRLQGANATSGREDRFGRTQMGQDGAQPAPAGLPRPAVSFGIAGGGIGGPVSGNGSYQNNEWVAGRGIAGGGGFPGSGSLPLGWGGTQPNMAFGDGELPGSEQYLPLVENDFLSPINEPLSTFSIDVDTASYSNVRRFLKQNQFPPADAVRIEEMVNYFHYDYPEPADGQPFSVNLEAGPCPWNNTHRLIRIGLKGKEIDKSQRPPSNLVFLLDVSGSMRDANKLPLVKTSMEMLAGEMTEDDRIAIVTYAGNAGLALESTSGQDKTRIIDAIHALNAGGSTNGEAGIKLAYEQATSHFIKNGTNRVILCTDGDFNVGTSGDDELVTLIQEQAKSKVFLSVLGFGMGNLKDGKLEKIADKGNGHYGYIDDEKEARKVFVEELVGTLYTIAKDVKIQVEFNPLQVGSYRLIGYENRILAVQDFNDDTKDAGEIGAGHTVTALYEVAPIDNAAEAKQVDDLKYQKPVTPNADDKVAQELLTLKLRYKQPEADESVKIDFALTDDKPRTEMPSVDFEWAASCAGFGLLLRNSQHRGQADFDLIRELAMGSRGNDESGRRREFLDLVYTAHAMYARQKGEPIPPRESLPEDKAREVAAVEGKYENLLKRIEVPADEAAYGNFTDFGFWAGNAWAGHENLPQGHWVYVAPHWYIWGKSNGEKTADRTPPEAPQDPNP